jgi:hypothetical protein
MMAQKSFFATFMGKMAAEALELHRVGSVRGLTSKGIFLQCGEYILFITDAPYKSPFNIYVPGFDRLMAELSVNTEFEATKEALVFHTHEIRIITENAEIWTPDEPDQLVTIHIDRVHLIESILNRISDIDPVKGWMFLFNLHSTLPKDLVDRISNNTRFFTKAYIDRNLDGCLESAGHLLGLGGGLTPSGDDWLAGFLLYQTRFQMAINKQAAFLAELTQKLLELAKVKTTTISTNRILAASWGWAEEPFLQVIDALFLGKTVSTDLVRLLTHFGHSSGVDTTLGIAASLECE